MMKSLSALLLFWSISFAAFSQAFYVSDVTGNDANPGTQASPWKTIQKACAAATPGSTVYILAGTYHEQLNLEVSGNAMDGTITFKPFEMDEVTVDGSTFMDPFTVLLTITDQSYVRFEGLNFVNASGDGSTGIVVDGSSSYIELVNNTISDLEGEGATGINLLGEPTEIDITGNTISNIVGSFAAGIIVQGASSHIRIMTNDISGIHFSSMPTDVPTAANNANPLVIYGNDSYAEDMLGMIIDPSVSITDVMISGNSVHDSRTGFSEGLTVSGNVDGFMISGNFVYNIKNIGIDVAGGYGASPDPLQDYARNGVVTTNSVSNCNTGAGGDVAAGIYIDGAQNILVEHNRVQTCGRGYEIGCEQPEALAFNVILRNNIAWNNIEAGIGIGGYNYPATTGKVEACQVLNNTCYNNSTFLAGGDGELIVEYTEDCVIKNNIFYSKNILDQLLVVRLNSEGEESVNLEIDYNIYYHEIGLGLVTVSFYGVPLTISEFFDATGQNMNSQFADPKFVNPENQDFHLGALSPAFDKGDPMFAPEPGEVDIDGDMRLLWLKVDIGADEATINLPVEYIRPLSARATQPGIELQWATATEHDAARFDIERSIDGAVFEKIGVVSARGSNSSYLYVDKFPATGANYYRLKQVDLDGRSELSNVAMAKWEAGTTGVFPNITADHFEIRNNTQGWSSAILRNNLGQISRNFTNGQETTLSGLEPGVYRLEVFVTEAAQPLVFSLVKK